MSAADLMDRIERARNQLQAARDQLEQSRPSNPLDDARDRPRPSNPLDQLGPRNLDYSRGDEALIRMHQEMISNLDDIDKMQIFNGLSGLLPSSLALPSRLAALAEFGWRVRQDGEWDHKPLLRRELGLDPDEEPGPGFYFPIRGNEQYEYNYDIWSNIHFGYVGMAAGFTDVELRGGAIAADGGTYVPADDLSVRIGIELWQEHGSNMTDEDLRQAVIDHTEEYRRIQNDTNIAVRDVGDGR
ncbi:polymorphic toxin type 44 domain-containing protein [Phormidesmis priestleyi]